MAGEGSAEAGVGMGELDVRPMLQRRELRGLAVERWQVGREGSSREAVWVLQHDVRGVGWRGVLLQDLGRLCAMAGRGGARASDAGSGHQSA